MRMAALETATCLYISILVQGIKSKNMTVQHQIDGLTHWMGRVPRSKANIDLLTPLVNKMISELKTRSVGHNMPAADSREDNDGEGGDYQADNTQWNQAAYPRHKPGRGAGQHTKK